MNRAIPAADFDAFVTQVATRVAGLSWGQIRAAKQTIDAALGNVDLADRYRDEGKALELVYPVPQEVVGRMATALADGLQTRAKELVLEQSLDSYH